MNTPSIGVCILCLSTAAAACGDSLGPALCAPGDSLAVSVTTSSIGLPPLFSWSPPCLMGEIVVDSGGFSGPNVWHVISDSNRVFPPVWYGSVPEGAHLLTAPQPLARGAVYTVSVWRWVSGTPNSSLYWRAGVASFAP